jgi:AcrR family transcriptional regulator
MPSITRKPSSTSEHRSAVEAQVLAAVERLLGRNLRYTQISVQQILTEAHVARSTFYVHFQDKSDLLSRLTGRLRQTLYDMAAQWEPNGPEGGLAGLVKTFETLIAYHREHAAVLAATTEIAAYDPGAHDFYTSDLDSFEAKTTTNLLGEQNTGRTPAEVDAGAASRIIVWGGERAIGHHISNDDGSGDAAFARELAATWWYGIYRRPANQAGIRV